jgi:hypothetical protein
MRSRFLACCGLLLLGGCTSTGVGNPAPQSLSLEIVNDDSASDPDQDLPTASIQDAALVLGELRFLPCDAALAPVVVDGPFVVNLKARETLPKIPEIAAPSGGFCGLDAPLAPAKRPAALAGRSLFFDGTRADGTFFIVYANMTGTLRLRTAGGAIWEGGEPAPKFFWALRPRRWLAQSELAEADPTPDATHMRAIVIDVDRHPGLYLAIRARLAGLSTLYADIDGDGVFSETDRAGAVGDGVDDAD